MTARYEQASGLVAASDLSDAAHDRMITSRSEILTLRSFSRDVRRDLIESIVSDKIPVIKKRLENFSM